MQYAVLFPGKNAKGKDIEWSYPVTFNKCHSVLLCSEISISHPRSPKDIVFK
jgi:hypothetical protein